jgi:OmpA-OmpF porin, OOP family
LLIFHLLLFIDTTAYQIVFYVRHRTVGLMTHFYDQGFNQPNMRVIRKKETTMKNIKSLGLCSLTVVSALFAGAAFAQDSYFYGGLGVGKSRAMVNDGAISDQLSANGTPMTSINVNESDTTFKGFVGYQMNRNIGVEAGYFNLGKSGFTATTTPSGSYSNERSIDGANLDLVGTLPLTEKWSAQARVGANYANVKDNTTKTGAVRLASGSASEKSLNLRYGLGVQYEVNPSLFIRAEADLNRVKHTDGSRGNYCNYAISVVIPFGRVAATPVAVVAPVYVPPAPVYVAPAPVVVIAPPPPPVVVAPEPAPMPMEVAPKRPAKQDRN